MNNIYTYYNLGTELLLQSELYRLLKNIIDTNQENHILEIGSQQGLFSCFFSDYLLNNKLSTLTCVDSFNSNNNKDNNNMKVQEIREIFLNNIYKSKNYDKCFINIMTSEEFFQKNEKMYNFIYINGNINMETEIKNILNAIIQSFKYLSREGILWINNYKYNSIMEKGINDFINEYNIECDVIHKGQQLAIRKR